MSRRINTSFFLMSARLVEFDHDKQEFVPGWLNHGR